MINGNKQKQHSKIKQKKLFKITKDRTKQHCALNQTNNKYRFNIEHFQ